MIKRNESKFGILLRHWVFANCKKLETSTFEIKQTQTDSLPFSALEEHQNNFSMAVKHSEKGVFMRMESGTIGAPDYVYVKKEPAFIVVRYPDLFCIIDIDKWNTERIINKRKSLTSERAKAIALTTIQLK